MKRFNLKRLAMAYLFFIAVTTVPQISFAAGPYATSVSTVVANGSGNGSAAFTAAGYPNITGNVSIRKIWFSNDGTLETVNVWKVCTSSTATSLIWTGVVAASATLSMDSLPLKFTVANPCFSKGLLGSGTVKVHVEYE